MERNDTSDLLSHATKALQTELWVATIYAMIARSYRRKDPQLASRLAELSTIEHAHVTFWTQLLTQRHHHVTSSVNPIRYAVFTALYRVLGLGLTLRLLEMGERELIAQYLVMLQGPHLTSDEKQNIINLLEHELEHEEEFEEYVSRYTFFLKKVSTISSQFSNGLVAVLTIATGFAGLWVTPYDIIIPGLIVGFTGAVSTLTGFYFFGRTQNTVRKSIIERLKMSIAITPTLFVDRVRKYLGEQQIGDDTAQAIVREAERNVEYLHDFIAEEEYGFSSGSLSDPLPDAVYAGILRLIGTVIPLIPYAVGVPLSLAIPVSILMTIVMLSVNGFFAAVAGELDIKQKVLELALTGLVLAAIAFGIGRLSSLLRTLI